MDNEQSDQSETSFDDQANPKTIPSLKGQSKTNFLELIVLDSSLKVCYSEWFMINFSETQVLEFPGPIQDPFLVLINPTLKSYCRVFIDDATTKKLIFEKAILKLPEIEMKVGVYIQYLFDTEKIFTEQVRQEARACLSMEGGTVEKLVLSCIEKTS